MDPDRLSRVSLPQAVPNGVSLWHLDLADAGLSIDGLSPDEAARTDRYRQHADRVRFSCTRRALRRLLAERLDMAPDSVPLTTGEYGKPMLDGFAWQFNLSHAGPHALIALSESAPVGVDIERIDVTRPLASMAAQFFTAREQAACAGQPEQFYRLWSAKEAVLKASGSGIRGDLPAIVEQDGQLAVVREPLTRLWEIEAPPGYAAALAMITRPA